MISRMSASAPAKKSAMSAGGVEEFAVPGLPGLAVARPGVAEGPAQEPAVGFASLGVEVVGMLALEQVEEVVGREERPLVDDASMGGVG